MRRRRVRTARRAAPPRAPAVELKRELQGRLRGGACAYCGAAATADRPLTREHAIPRSRGGGRRDWRVIVPACLDCNLQRGCQPLSSFLLASPCRITRLIDFLASLPVAAVRQVDVRVFAELCAAVWLLQELGGTDADWRSAGRSKRLLLRCRHAARRILTQLAERLGGDGPGLRPDRGRDRVPAEPAPGAVTGRPRTTSNFGGRGALLRLAAVLAAAWGSWEAIIARELLRSMSRERARATLRRARAPLGSPRTERRRRRAA